MITRVSDAELAELAIEGRLVGYFGYGSLVNRATLRTGIVAAYPARLSGWRRFWRAPPDLGSLDHDRERPALLTVGRQAGAAIDGLLVIDLAENLAAVDAREIHYHRRDIAAGDLSFPAATPAFTCPLHVYEAREDVAVVPGAPLIWRSYLDAVMQGFRAEYGADGVRRFIAETAGFDFAIAEDRAAPLYPRAVRLDGEEIGLYDALTARLKAAAT